MAPPLVVETYDADGFSGPPFHQLAIGMLAPRQNDDSVRIKLTHGMVEGVDIYFSAVNKFILDRPEAVVGKPVLPIQDADVGLLARAKDLHVMLGPKVLRGRVDISGPVCPKESQAKGPAETSIRKLPGNLPRSISVHLVLQ